MAHGADPRARAGRADQERLDLAFAALAHPTRRAAVELLRRGPRCAGELADQLGSTPAGLSRHLRVLRESGLIGEGAPEEDGRVRLLHLEREPFDELQTWIEDALAFWTGQLASFKAHAEARRGERARR